MLTVDQAHQILTKFQAAAPPSAAEKLAQVIEFLHALERERAALASQLQEDRVLAKTAHEPPTNGIQAVDAPSVETAATDRSRARSTHSVTDQLAEVFEMISTGESEPAAADPAGASEQNSQIGVPPRSDWEPTSQLETAEDLQMVDDGADPIAWLKQSMPQLVLSQEEQQAIDKEVLAVSARLKTAPILDLMLPMQTSLRPTMIQIRSDADQLQAGKIGALTTEQTASARSIRDHADSALSLLDAVEQVTAVQEGRFSLQMRAFLCADLVKRARDMMQPAARARAHRITLVPPEHVLAAYADYEHSLGVLIDLLDNAIRYSPLGSITRITLDDLGSHVVVNVIDSGIGLSEEDYANVGKPFWRALHQPLVRSNPGSGLRLYLAQRILALQGGELIFSGEPDAGSTFSFTLRSAAVASGDAADSDKADAQPSALRA
jgi:signal transduction histidine kinase